MDHNALAKDYFERHPSNDECHVTSDNRVFHNLGAAQSFAGTLDDQKISSFNRKVLLKEEKDTENDDSSKNAEKAEKLKELAALELVKENYNQMKSLVKYFEVKTEDQKAETLIAALTEFKTTLNQ